MLTFIQKNVCCKATGAHSLSLGARCGCLKETFIVTMQESPLPEVSLWKRLYILMVVL